VIGVWYGFSPEAWAEWCIANGFDPSDLTATMAKIQAAPTYECMKCKQPLDLFEVYIQIDPVAPILAPKFLHRDCFVAHLEEHGHEQDDQIVCFLYRKKV
jgi:hypothetical protein